MTGSGADVRELLAGLTRAHERAVRAHDGARRAVALLPADADGTDPAGAVSVTLDAGGLPTAVRVSQDWPDRLPPAAFAGAVCAACRAAEHARLAIWAERLARPGPAVTEPHRVSPPDDEPAGTPAGSAAEAVHALQRRLHAATSGATSGATASVPADPVVTGRAAGGMLTVTVARDGLRACSADPAWVARQNAGGLATAVGAAVQHAREQWTPPEHAAGRSVLSGIARDAIAVLDGLTG